MVFRTSRYIPPSFTIRSRGASDEIRNHLPGRARRMEIWWTSIAFLRGPFRHESVSTATGFFFAGMGCLSFGAVVADREGRGWNSSSIRSCMGSRGGSFAFLVSHGGICVSTESIGPERDQDGVAAMPSWRIHCVVTLSPCCAQPRELAWRLSETSPRSATGGGHDRLRWGPIRHDGGDEGSPLRR